jgi:1-deoxy-D-xylulose 5-phosphate reductoisomerase
VIIALAISLRAVIYIWDLILLFIQEEPIKITISDIKINNALNEVGFILINVLNEILVERFMQRKILFSDITVKLLAILNSKIVKNYLKISRIRHINDVFRTYNFSRSLVI